MKKNIFVVAAVLIGSTLHAQTDTGKVLTDFIVTANKFEQKQNTTGKVVTVISKEQIEKSNGKTVAELLNDQVGIVVNGALNNIGSVQSLYMRGGNYGRTLVLVDGIPVSDPSDINNTFDINMLALSDIERIEICKGAQSAIYGSDAEAGVINIITTKSDVKKPFNVSASTVVGNYGLFKGNAQIYGNICNKVTYKVAYSKLYTEGFSAAYDSSGTKNFDKDGYNGDVLSTSLGYDISKQFTVNAYFKKSTYKTAIDANPFKDDIDYTSTNTNIMAGGNVQFKQQNFALTGNYRYSDIHRNLLNDSTDGSHNYSNSNFYGKTHFAEAFAKVNLGAGFSAVPGISYTHASMNSSLSYYSLPWGGVSSTAPNTAIDQGSAYLSILFNNKDFSVDLGGRYNVYSRYGNNLTFTFNPLYKIDSNHRVFGSISTAYKVPSLYQLFDTYSGNVNLKPEESINYEIGFQEQYADVNSRIVAFYRHTNNVIDFDYYNTYQYFNTKDQNVGGLEYEITIKPIKGITVTGNYTYLNITEHTQNRAGFKDTVYTYGLNKPAHVVNVTVGYSLKDKLYVSVGGKYSSSKYGYGGYGQQDVLLPNYFILNGYAEYKWNTHYKIFTDLKNITDKKFFDVRGYNSIPFVFNSGILISW